MLLGAQSVGFDAPLVASTTTTTAPVAAVTTTTEPAPTVTTAAAAPTTTSTEPVAVPTTTTTVPPMAATVENPAGSTTGQATWYAQAAPGGCASPSLPRGTELEVVNDADGASTSCVVDDREATNVDRVLDLSVTGFASLAPVTQGVITVTITW